MIWKKRIRRRRKMMMMKKKKKKTIKYNVEIQFEFQFE
jgi:hypothetical protein